jgi:CheY-like chemotaxis protein
MSFRFDAFISFSNSDADWVRDWLLPRLAASGLQICTVDDFDLGVPRPVNIERAIDNSRHTVLILSPAWIESDWSQFEAALVQTSDPAASHRRLIPLLFQVCKLPRRIAMLDCANFTSPQAQESQVQRVINAIKGEVSFSDRDASTTPPQDTQPPKVPVTEPSSDHAPEGAISEKATDPPSELQDLFIFLVEDSLSSANKLANILYKAGAVVVETELSAERARRRLEKSPYPDIVITSHKLLGSETGSDLADWMSKRSSLNDTLRISYSQATRRTILEGRSNELFHGIISKPIQTSDLLKTLKDARLRHTEIANQPVSEQTENTINPIQPTKKPSIIIVDRYTGILSSIITYIGWINEVKEYEAVAFLSGSRALEYFKGRSIPLVITDCHIFGMDGWEFIAKIKQRSPDTRIALLTAAVGSDTRERANDLGVDYFLWKPFAFDELELILLDALR